MFFYIVKSKAENPKFQHHTSPLEKTFNKFHPLLNSKIYSEFPLNVCSPFSSFDIPSSYIICRSSFVSSAFLAVPYFLYWYVCNRVPAANAPGYTAA